MSVKYKCPAGDVGQSIILLCLDLAVGRDKADSDIKSNNAIVFAIDPWDKGYTNPA